MLKLKELPDLTNAQFSTTDAKNRPCVRWPAEVDGRHINVLIVISALCDHYGVDSASNQTIMAVLRDHQEDIQGLANTLLIEDANEITLDGDSFSSTGGL